MQVQLRVKEIWWNGANGDECLRPKEGQRMETLNEFHGDYDMDWVVLFEGDKEISRHNVQYIASIVWE